MPQAFGFDEAGIIRVRDAVRKIEGDTGPTPSRPLGRHRGDFIERWVVINSTTQTAGRYPGQWVLRDAIADTYTPQGSSGDIWVKAPNGETLALDARYLAQLNGVLADGKAEYDVTVGGSGSGGNTDWVRITSTTKTGYLYPGKTLTYNEDGNVWGDNTGTIWIQMPNAEAPVLGKRYLGRANGNLVGDGLPVYVVTVGELIPPFSGARVYNDQFHSVNISGSVNADWYILWDHEDYDKTAYFPVAGQALDAFFRAPADGYYHIGVCVPVIVDSLSANSFVHLQLRLAKFILAPEDMASQSALWPAAAVGFGPSLHVETTVYLSAGDLATATLAWNTIPGSASFSGRIVGATEKKSAFHIERIGLFT